MIELHGSAGAIDLFVRSGLLPVYYMIVVALYVYGLIRYKCNKWTIYVTLVFNTGIFYWLGWVNIWKIGIVLYTVFLFIQTKSYRYIRYFGGLTLVLALWTGWYFISCYVNEVPFLMTFSQYGIKYFSMYLLFLIMFNMLRYRNVRRSLFYFLKYALLLQSILSIVKYTLWGVLGEALVGSLTFTGGGPNNIIPIAGFLLIWSYKQGRMTIKDWIYCLFLFVSPVFGGKRSVWFFSVYVIGGCLLFAYNRIDVMNVLKRILKYIPLMLLVFVLGVKLNPSLNPEGKVWGTFSMEYVYDYSKKYIYGDDQNRTGRGGRFVDFFSNNMSSGHVFWGYGIDIMKSSYGDFDTALFGVDGKGEVGAALGDMYSYGIIGMLLLLLYEVMFFVNIRDKRLRFIVLSFLLLEYIIFYNQFFVSLPMFMVTFFAINVTNIRVDMIKRTRYMV